MDEKKQREYELLRAVCVSYINKNPNNRMPLNSKRLLLKAARLLLRPEFIGLDVTVDEMIALYAKLSHLAYGVSSKGLPKDNP